MNYGLKIEVVNEDGTVNVVSPDDSVTVEEPASSIQIESGILYRVPKNYGLITWNGSFLKIS